MPYFADTSALATLYVPETGSAWMQSLSTGGLIVSGLTIVEIASTLARHEREGALVRSDVDLLWRAVTEDLSQWTLVRLTEAILGAATSIFLSSAVLRSLDAIQLACALEARRRTRRQGIGPLVVLTADARLETGARQLGLDTDNPSQHP